MNSDISRKLVATFFSVRAVLEDFLYYIDTAEQSPQPLQATDQYFTIKVFSFQGKLVLCYTKLLLIISIIAIKINTVI